MFIPFREIIIIRRKISIDREKKYNRCVLIGLVTVVYISPRVSRYFRTIWFNIVLSLSRLVSEPCLICLREFQPRG